MAEESAGPDTRALVALLDAAQPEVIAAVRRKRSLARYIPSVTPIYETPDHLAPVMEVFELAIKGIPQRVVIHAPPRHAKSETGLHGIGYGLGKRPDLRFGYASYGASIAYSKSRVARAIVKRAELELETEAVKEWRTPEGGGLLATGIRGEMTGHGIDILLIDDAVKNRLEAESATFRNNNDDWLRDVALTRIEPNGSVILFGTRWHPDDIMGRCIKAGWRYIRLPALNDDGSSLWPKRWPADAIRARRKEVGEYTFESLFQGNPRSRGGSVFGDAWCYEKLPQEYRPGFGLDFAYTSKTSADYSVLITMFESRGYYYVVDMIRVQEKAPLFAERIRQAKRRYPSARMRWYAAGTEQGVADFVRPMLKGIGLEVLPPRGDKFTRAINYAAAWNAGKILVPEDVDANPWVTDFIVEHASFTGVNDDADDIIDASGSCFDVLSGGGGASTVDDEVKFQRRM